MGKPYKTLAPEQVREQLELLWAEYNSFKEIGLRLDMSRGKPCPAQLEMSNGIFDTLHGDYKSADGIDTRNYGELTGLAEMKAVFAGMLGIAPDSVIVGGSSSLNLMYDTISRAMTHGLADSKRPWSHEEKVRFLCPVPGYDRHFAVTEHFGIEMVNVPMSENGPDMDMVEALAREDDTIKGIWCVPLYANPNGAIYSDEVIRRLAAMRCAAADFTIMWDNAYCVHHLYGSAPNQPDILRSCENAGNPNRVILFASTSKITFSGAGVCCLAGSAATRRACENALKYQTITFDKVNQLAHARFLRDLDTVNALMARHAAILRPKFKIVDDVFSENLGGLEIATWTKPLGGYFINLVTPRGTAARIVALCGDANVVLTPAGAAFPYGNDPEDCNIRIAPSFPSEDELARAAELLCICTRIAALEKRL